MLWELEGAASLIQRRPPGLCTSSSTTKPLNYRVVGAVHDTVTEGHLENFLEGNVWPYRVRDVADRLSDFIGAERHVRANPHPPFHRPFGCLGRRAMRSEEHTSEL